MPGPATLAVIEAEIEQVGKATLARRYYLASVAVTAERFAAALRAHW